MLFKNGVYMSNQEYWKEMGFETQDELVKTCNKINELLKHPKGSAIKQLIEWRKIGLGMVKILKANHEIVQGSAEIVNRINDSVAKKSNQRWTQEEDEKLIEAVCSGKFTIVEISCSFGRSPTAIKTRVSHLVGVSRISQEIAGKFIGTLNGACIEGNIRGKLQKTSKNKQNGGSR